MLCQVCGFRNPDDEELCARCQQKLLVVSGAGAVEEDLFEDSEGEEGFSFDEHLLERISILEEVVKRTSETLRQVLSALHKQERSILSNQTGQVTLRDLLERKRLIGREEWNELWESKMGYQLHALEKRERFAAVKDRILALYQGQRRSRFRRLLDEAELAFYGFEPAQGVAALEAAFKLDRENYELALFLGETWFADGDGDRALGYYSRLLAARPDHFEGLVFSGVVHYERGELGRAGELLRRAVSLYPDEFLPLFALGAAHAAEGQLSRAVVCLERAVALEPLSEALYLLGNCLFEMGRSQAAARHLEEAVRHDPALEEAYYLLGLVYLDRRWNRKALAAFRQAQRLNPKRMQYQDLVRYLTGTAGHPLPAVEGKAGEWLGRGEAFLQGGDEASAITGFRRALALAPEHPTVLISYALACLQLDRREEIESVARRLLDLDLGEMLRATAYATLIEALRGEGRCREGNRIGQRMLAEGSSDFSKTVAYYEMAYNLAEMEEDLDDALEFAHRSLEHAPDELRQFPLAALGWVHYKRREFDQAVDFLSRSTDLESSATTLTHLGMALLAAGEKDRARSVLEQARSLEDRGGAVELKMMQVMKNSGRLLERVRRRQKKS